MSTYGYSYYRRGRTQPACFRVLKKVDGWKQEKESLPGAEPQRSSSQKIIRGTGFHTCAMAAHRRNNACVEVAAPECTIAPERTTIPVDAVSQV